MHKKLVFTNNAENDLKEIGENKSKKGLYAQVLKTLELLQCNSRHPSLKTHEYPYLKGRRGEKVWEAYVQEHQELIAYFFIMDLMSSKMENVFLLSQLL